MADPKDIFAEMERQIKASTDDLRPPLDLAVRTIGEAMDALPGGGATPDLMGPDVWTWVDPRGKVFAVAPSAERNGHPMLTIRQPISKALGAWITTTALLLGEDRTSILNSATVAIVNHTGAFAGYQSVVGAIAREGSPLAGIDRACEIAGRDPAVNSAVATALRGSSDKKDPGGLN